VHVRVCYVSVRECPSGRVFLLVAFKFARHQIAACFIHFLRSKGVACAGSFVSFFAQEIWMGRGPKRCLGYVCACECVCFACMCQHFVGPKPDSSRTTKAEMLDAKGKT